MEMRLEVNVYNYSIQIQAFRDNEVALPKTIADILYARRKANRDRIVSRQGDYFPNTKITNDAFQPQGSMAIGTAVQKCFSDEEYDIDDGLIVPRDRLTNQDGKEMTATAARKALCDLLADDRFARQPKLMDNCVRVFYADADSEKHHVDIPIYRTWTDNDGTHLEIASVSGWKESNPTQVNSWCIDLVAQRNLSVDGWGTQTRQLVQLMKRFCRSRQAWLELLPNGMKLTMLVVEACSKYEPRLDQAIRHLFTRLSMRLSESKVIRNLAHPLLPEITRSGADPNVVELKKRIDDALVHLYGLDSPDHNSCEAARAAWENVFKTNGFFAQYDNVAKASVTKRPIWCAMPSWPMDLKYPVTLAAKIDPTSLKGERYLGNDAEPIPKGLSLNFKLAVPESVNKFDTYWQIVNTGDEAKDAKGLRGGFEKSQTAGHGGLRRPESTGYSGRHWIEAFVVRNGICVGRSGPFYVNVG
jgi:hypothetical protein